MVAESYIFTGLNTTSLRFELGSANLMEVRRDTAPFVKRLGNLAFALCRAPAFRCTLQPPIRRHTIGA